MTEPTTDIDEWITESTNYILHLNTAILYKECPTVEIPLVEIVEISDDAVVCKTPVDVGEDTASVNDTGGRRGYPIKDVSQIEFLKQ